MSNAQCVIIGGGLAGTSLALALFRGGMHSIIVDAHGVGCGGSGNSVGLALPDTGRSEEIPERDRAGYAALVEAIHHHEANGRTLHAVRGPVIQFPVTERLKARVNGEGVDIDSLSRLSGSICKSPGLLLEGVAISPRALCRAHVAGACAQMVPGSARCVEWLDGVWQVIGQNGEVLAAAPYLCIANAADASTLPETAWLKLERVRGQVAEIPGGLPGFPRIPVCFDGYVVPIPHGGGYLVGADYDHISRDTRIHPGISRSLIRRIHRWMATPCIGDLSLRARVAFRASTHDRQPYVGAVPDYYQFRKLATTALSARRPVAACQTLLENLPYLPRCYVSVGHGSRGLVSAHYAAEVLASTIRADFNGSEMPCLDESLLPKRLLGRLLRDLRGVSPRNHPRSFGEPTT